VGNPERLEVGRLRGLGGIRGTSDRISRSRAHPEVFQHRHAPSGVPAGVRIFGLARLVVPALHAGAISYAMGALAEIRGFPWELERHGCRNRAALRSRQAALRFDWSRPLIISGLRRRSPREKRTPHFARAKRGPADHRGLKASVAGLSVARFGRPRRESP